LLPVSTLSVIGSAADDDKSRLPVSLQKRTTASNPASAGFLLAQPHYSFSPL
jgi:hypothetical protein